jgi:hypothetical protein
LSVLSKLALLSSTYCFLTFVLAYEKASRSAHFTG